MTKLFDLYIAFDGRFARLPFFIRDIYLGIACGALFMLSIPLFSAGNSAGYWSGLIVVGAFLALFCLGALSLFVRRLHDLGFSGYHVIWVAAAQLISTVLSYGPLKAVLLSLPFAIVGLWLLFWPGNKKANRFGEVPG